MCGMPPLLPSFRGTRMVATPARCRNSQGRTTTTVNVSPTAASALYLSSWIAPLQTARARDARRRLLKALCPFWEGCCCCRLRATGNAITPSPRDGGSYRVALQQYKSFWQDSTLDLCQAGRRRSFARQGLSDEASRSLVLVGVCGDDSALWGYGRKPPLTHILPHYHVTWRTPAAPPLGDAFDLAHPPLPVLRTGAARRLFMLKHGSHDRARHLDV